MSGKPTSILDAAEQYAQSLAQEVRCKERRYSFEARDAAVAKRKAKRAALAEMTADAQSVAARGEVVVALQWLRSALDCGDFIWEPDQHADAESAYAAAIATQHGENT